MISESLQFLLRSWGSAIFLAAIAFLIGRRAFDFLRLSFDSAWEEFSFSACAGLGIIAMAIFALGTFGFIQRNVLSGVVGFLVALSFPVLQRSVRAIAQTRRPTLASVLAILLAAAILMPFATLALYPPTANDALAYHLAAAKEYVQSGLLAPTPQLRYAVFPQLSEMLFSGALLLGGDILAQCVSLLFLLITCSAVVGFLRGSFGDAAALWGGALLLSSTVVANLGSIAYADMPLTAFVALSVLAIERWRREDSSGWLVVSGFMAGCAAGAKYTALFFPPVLAIMIVVARKERRVMRPLLIVFLSFVTFALPWYAYSAYQTGNPVWPFFSRLFGLAYWNETDLAEQMADLVSTHGTGSSLGALLLLPWNLLVHPELFHTDGVLSLPFLACIPFAFYGALRDGPVRRLASVVLAYTVFWFFSAQILRYLIPVVPLAAVAEAAGIRLFARRFMPVPLRRSAPLALLLGLALLAPGWMMTLREVGTRGLPPVTPEARDRYLENRLRSYAAIEYLNNRAGSSYTLYAYHEPQMAYFAAGRFRGDYFGPWRYRAISSALEAGEDTLRGALQAMGVTHLLIRDDPSGSGCDERWLERRFVVPLFRSSGVVLFEISDRPLRAVIGRDLAGEDSAAPSAGARTTIRTSVTEGRLYYCSFSSAGGASGGMAALDLAWLRRDGTWIKNDQSPWALAAGTEEHRLLATAPRDAAYALLALDSADTVSSALQRPSMCEIRFLP